MPRHPAVRYVVIAFVATLALLNFLTATLFGFFVLVLGIYLLLPVFTSFHPWGVFDAFMWAAEHDAQSLLTVVGFSVAYMLSISAWKQQKAMEIKLASVAEILQFFDAANREISALDIFASNLNAAHAQSLLDPPPDLSSETKYILGKLPEMQAARQSMSRRAIDLHTLRSSHDLVISNSIATMIAFNAAQKAFAEIAEAMWFPMPIGVETADQFVDWFGRSDARKWAHFERVSNSAGVSMSAAAGGLRGFVQGPFFKPGPATLMRLWDTSKSFHDGR